MKREALDHLLRAAGEVTGHRRFVLVGSNAIFAWRDAAPEPMSMSREADIYALDVSDEEAEEISDVLANIGQMSEFDASFGYYVDGVAPTTAVLPVGWRGRSMVYESPATNGVVAVVPHPDDIALSKLCAGREKDMDWVAAGVQSGLIDLDKVASRVERLPERPDVDRAVVRDRIEIARRREV
jgi:hypothetical protein